MRARRISLALSLILVACSPGGETLPRLGLDLDETSAGGRAEKGAPLGTKTGCASCVLTSGSSIAASGRGARDKLGAPDFLIRSPAKECGETRGSNE